MTNSAARRDGDRRIFTDPETARILEEEQIQVITWREFREMQSKTTDGAGG